MAETKQKTIVGLNYVSGLPRSTTLSSSDHTMCLQSNIDSLPSLQPCLTSQRLQTWQMLSFHELPVPSRTNKCIIAEKELEE